MARNDRIVGIDVSKAKVDACIRSLQLRCSEPSTPEGVAAMVAWLQAHQVTTAVLEATGQYERRAQSHAQQITTLHDERLLSAHELR